MTEMEVPDSVLMEDNSNVEKAEAYMKELEDVSGPKFCHLCVCLGYFLVKTYSISNLRKYT